MTIAFRMLGSDSDGNSQSTVGPITCTTLPIFSAITEAPVY
uniref:Uncharacterized protein n=1 Tax=uncultured bacterium pAW1 TaxID=1781155 RepID=A0A1C9U4S0_9BACT|nr:hypothetical protein [uncultured bacterium pAW1]